MIEPASIVHRVKCATITLLVFDFDHARLQAQLAGRLGGSFALLVRKRVESDSDEASARERLASDALYQGATEGVLFRRCGIGEPSASALSGLRLA
jgi:hypothetical protein